MSNALERIAEQFEKAGKTFEAMNNNLADIRIMLRADLESRTQVMGAALEEFEKDVTSLPDEEFPIDFTGLTVKIVDRAHERYGERGTVVGADWNGVIVAFEGASEPEAFTVSQFKFEGTCTHESLNLCNAEGCTGAPEVPDGPE